MYSSYGSKEGHLLFMEGERLIWRGVLIKLAQQ